MDCYIFNLQLGIFSTRAFFGKQKIGKFGLKLNKMSENIIVLVEKFLQFQ